MMINTNNARQIIWKHWNKKEHRSRLKKYHKKHYNTTRTINLTLIKRDSSEIWQNTNIRESARNQLLSNRRRLYDISQKYGPRADVTTLKSQRLELKKKTKVTEMLPITITEADIKEIDEKLDGGWNSCYSQFLVETIHPRSFGSSHSCGSGEYQYHSWLLHSWNDAHDTQKGRPNRLITDRSHACHLHMKSSL